MHWKMRVLGNALKNACLLLFSIEISNIDFVLNENIFNELFKSLIDQPHSCFNSHCVQCLYITKWQRETRCIDGWGVLGKITLTIDRTHQSLNNVLNTIKHVCKWHSMESENVPFIRAVLVLFINGKYEVVLYRQWFVI